MLREKIVRHMDEMPYRDSKGRIYRYGEFFPPEFSPFAYNETIAHEFFPLSKKIAEEKGYAWGEETAKMYPITRQAVDLPDHINDTGEEIKEEVLRCISCEKAYRIIPMELAFYKKIGLSVPRSCPSCRYLRRLGYRNPPRFYKRKCGCIGEKDENGVYANQANHFHGVSPCSNEFETSYMPDRPEAVYCEVCYQSEIL